MNTWDFPDGLVVKTSPSNAWGCGFNPWSEAKIPYTSWTKKKQKKTKNRSTVVTNSITTLKL